MNSLPSTPQNTFASFLRLFGLFSLNYYKQSIWKGLLAVLGIALGVAVLFSMNTATFSAFDQFKDSINQIAGTTTFEIKSKNAPLLKESVLKDVYEVLDESPTTRYFQAHPVLELPTLLLKKDAQRRYELSGVVLNVLGVDIFNDAGHRSLEWEKSPDYQSLSSNALNVLSPKAVVISNQLAKELGVVQGGRLPVLLQERIVRLKVVGIFKTTGLNQALRNVAFTDISTLQNLSHTAGLLSRVELDLNELDEAQQNATRNALLSRLPDDLEVLSPSQRSANMSEMLRSYQVNLMALSFITLIVAAFLIYNTLSMAVLQRRQMIGTYRLLGISTRLLALFIQMEALLLGTLGSLLGLFMGASVLPVVGQAVSNTLQTVYTGQATSSFEAPFWLPVACFLIGLGTSLLGAFFPVQEALQIQPVECVRPLTENIQQFNRRHKLGGWGVILLLLAWGLAQLPPYFNLPLGGYASAFLILAGGTLLIPSVLSRFLSAFQKIAYSLHFPVWIRVGVSLLKGGMHRSAVAVASLMVALALSISLTTLIGSFRHSVEDWIFQSLKADIFVQPASATTNRSVGLISAETVQRLSQDEAIRAADPFLEQAFVYHNQPFYLGATQLNTFSSNAVLTFTHGENSKSVLRRTLALSSPLELNRKNPFPTVISEPFANKHGLQRGDTFTLQMPKAPLRLKVEGVYFDYASSLGYAIIHRDVYKRFGGTQADASTSLALYLKPNQNPDEVIQRLKQKLPQGVLVSMRSNQGLRQEVLAIFDKTFAITYLMQGVALLISILTVLHALTTLILDAKRIYATLDYLGMSRWMRLQLVMNQGVGLSLLGYALAFVFGMMLASVLIYVLNAQSFGWTVPLQVQWGFLLSNLGWVILAGLLASLLPMWLLRRQVSTSVLRYE